MNFRSIEKLRSSFLSESTLNFRLFSLNKIKFVSTLCFNMCIQSNVLHSLRLEGTFCLIKATFSNYKSNFFVFRATKKLPCSLSFCQGFHSRLIKNQFLVLR